MEVRHAYLNWLDERGSTDLRSTLFAVEAKVNAKKTGRRWPEVMREVERFWKLEQRVLRSIFGSAAEAGQRSYILSTRSTNMSTTAIPHNSFTFSPTKSIYSDRSPGPTPH